MKTIEEYESDAFDILDRRQRRYESSPEMAETITQLMLLDFMSELREFMQQFTFGFYGSLNVKEES